MSTPSKNPPRKSATEPADPPSGGGGSTPPPRDDGERVPPGFRRLIFFLDTRQEIVRLVAVRRQGGGVAFSKRESRTNPQELDGFTRLAALAAGIRLILLTRPPDPSAVNEGLVQLQKEFGMQPLADKGHNAGVAGGYSDFLNSSLDGSDSAHRKQLNKGKSSDLFPLYQKSSGKGSDRTYTTLLHEQVSVDPAEGLTADHFRFARCEDLPAAFTGDEGETIADDELVDLLNAGMSSGSDFRGDWERFAEKNELPLPPSKLVPLAELGPFLKSYLPLIGRRVEDFSTHPDPGQWPGDVRTLNDVLQRLREFHEGRVNERVPFRRLKWLLHQHVPPGRPADVPGLMAEWLCARPVPADRAWVALAYGEFYPPLCPEIDLEAGYAANVRYKNAPVRMSMECAFVHLTLNENPKHSPVRALDDLIHLHDEKAVADVVPHSNLHVHPGDEFLLVLDGAVVVQYENTGVWTPMAVGDTAQFNAEIPHAVWNLGDDKAEVLIVRFFQRDRHSTRLRQVRALRQVQKKMEEVGRGGRGGAAADLPKADDNEVFGHLESGVVGWIDNMRELYLQWTQIDSWIQDRTRSPQDRLRKTDAKSVVLDPVGLARFLDTHLLDIPADRYGTGGRKELTDLRDAVMKLRAGDKWYEADRKPNKEEVKQQLRLYAGYLKCLDAVCKSGPLAAQPEKARSAFRGVTVEGEEPDVTTLEVLRTALNIPRVLLDGYLAPPALRMVFVRGADAAVPARGFDWVAPPAEADDRARRDDTIRGTQYMIPSRVLANSDMSVVLLTLEPDGQTDWNQHPGYEAVIPLNGRVTVELEPAPGHRQLSTPADKTGLLLYRSNIPHRVKSVDGPARAIVIRFNIPSG